MVRAFYEFMVWSVGGAGSAVVVFFFGLPLLLAALACRSYLPLLLTALAYRSCLPLLLAALTCRSCLPLLLAALAGHPWPCFDASPWHYESLLPTAAKVTKSAVRSYSALRVAARF